MDIINNLISRDTEVDTAVVLSYKANNFYVIKSGNVTHTAKSIIGPISEGATVLVLKTTSIKYIIGFDKGASRKRKEVIVNG